MLFRQLYFCACLFSLSLIGAIGLLAITFNLVSPPDVHVVAAHYWHMHDMRVADVVKP